MTDVSQLLNEEDECMAEIAVAVVNYNTREYLRACLASTAAEQPYELIVVDNASSDGSVAMVRKEFPTAVLHANERNPGFGAAVNQAVARCTAPYVLCLNSDTVLLPGILRVLAAYLDANPRAAIVGPRLLNVDGSLQPSCFPFPTPFNEFLELSSLSKLVRHLPFVHGHYLRVWSHNRSRRVAWVLGAALAIRRNAFDQVGGFDEEFFMYCEEIDLCYRLYQAGWEVHFTPDTCVEHWGGASTVQARAVMAVCALISTITFYKRHYSRWRLLQLKLILAVMAIAKMLRDTIRLLWTREKGKRARLAEDLDIWRRVLGSLQS
jgi:N-acetylglucosaminyl-diphospho-decaprenol L-rhamnosyltransferase